MNDFEEWMDLDDCHTPAFCTGSRVYGKPRPDSDLDLVVYVDDQVTRQLLADYGGNQDEDGTFVFRFGKLNLIVCDEAWQYDEWVEATEACKTAASIDGPLERQAALDIHSDYRSREGY